MYNEAIESFQNVLKLMVNHSNFSNQSFQSTKKQRYNAKEKHVSL